ncbi:SatD family protein [Halobaculum magnesiiphilum]|uniref:SatD family protein n=1 Tax=Halobaculum magnesiiphilum TaxID=1017351 RepID=A0A8T8W958_9EURY|nr:SatD family protein [Halobaculum magnesiiphilum]QZP36368.1 SatD family protein [Halobaculum magnesiiphilum]
MTGTERTHVVLGDVIDSRGEPDREGLRERIEDALAAANDAHAEAIGARFAPIKGADEFGGTLEDPAAAYGVVRAIQERLHPTVARYVVVAGAVDVNPGATDVTAMDGPAFHRADEALSELNAEDGHFFLDTADDRVNGPVTAAGDLALAIREEWTERQTEIARAYRRRGTQTAVAEAFGVSTQAVSKTLAAASYDRVRRNEALIDRALGAEPED